jgi:drug/metabolite transporter (DMT)-like permease
MFQEQISSKKKSIHKFPQRRQQGIFQKTRFILPDIFSVQPAFFFDIVGPMKKGMSWLLLILFGTVWGLNELAAGGAFYPANPALGAVWLTAIALLVLAAARALVNRPGSSTLIGVVAALYKAVNTEPFYCHLLGIVFVGLAFDGAAWLFLRGRKEVDLRACCAGIVGAYLGNALFACLMAFVVQSEFWAVPGLEKFKDHLFITGTQVALASAFLVPLGFWAGLRLKTFLGSRPQWAVLAASTSSLALWIVGILSA